MLPVGFELAILASERPQIHAVDRGATGIRENVTESDIADSGYPAINL